MTEIKKSEQRRKQKKGMITRKRENWNDKRKTKVNEKQTDEEGEKKD